MCRCLSGLIGVLLSARALPLSLFLYTAVFYPWRFGVPVRPLCGNAEPFLFNGWSNNLAGRLSDQRHLINGACSLFNQLFCSFSLRLGQERLWVGIFKGRYINLY